MAGTLVLILALTGLVVALASPFLRSARHRHVALWWAACLAFLCAVIDLTMGHIGLTILWAALGAGAVTGAETVNRR